MAVMPTTHLSGKHDLREAYRVVQQRIAEAAAHVGRRPDDVMLLAVTSHATPDQMRQIIELGQTDLAEQQVSQLVQRVEHLREFLGRKRFLQSRGGQQSPDSPASQQVRWHMIGSVERSSLKDLVPKVRLIHTVENLRLAEDLHTFGARHEDKLAGPIDILLHVNTTGEENHPGMLAPAVTHVAGQIDTMLHLRLRGLMITAPADTSLTDDTYARAAELFHDIRTDLPASSPFTVLSMGTSADFETAIHRGANLIRIGSALFGAAG